MASVYRFVRRVRSRRVVAMSFASIFVLTAVCLLAASPATAADDPSAEVLQVSLDAVLSVQGTAVNVIVEGADQVPETADATAAAGLTSSDIAVALYGPLSLEEMIRAPDRLPEPESPELVWVSAAADTARMETVLAPDAVERPGAYLLIVTARSSSGSLVRGSAWLGRVAAEGPTADIAFVWPLVRGVHRDVAGVFFSDALAEALDPAAEVSLWGATTWAQHFPELHFSLAVEPVLLTQLIELSDGYQSLAGTQAVEEISPAQGSPARAAELLAALEQTAQSDAVDVIVAPYAGASPAVTAERGWDDGFAQVQLGRQVTQQVLGLEQPVNGAFSPSLDMSTASIGCFSRAFIDHVLVDTTVAEDVAETEQVRTVSARVRDAGAERLTLLFADSRVREFVAAPWDVGLLCAGLAAHVASSPGQPLIVTPASLTGVPPQTYLESLGAAITQVDRLRTRTLSELVREHPPGTRPVYLDRPAVSASTYIALALFESVAEAHEAVEALAQVAGPSPSTVQKAQLLLFTAESDWWSFPGTLPEVADVGLTYAREAKTVADAELAKIVVKGVRDTRVMGRRGSISLLLENSTPYPVEAEVSLRGSGVQLPDGAVVAVSMPPGETVLPVEVAGGSGTRALQVELLSGTYVIDDWDGELRFITVMAFVPWVTAAIVLIALTVFVVALRRSRAARTDRLGSAR